MIVFDGNRKLYKANLHLHTNLSDGRKSPEEARAIYRENGYDFLAITDHRIYNYTNFAPETGITVIPGMEFDNGSSIPCPHGFRTYQQLPV